jgi:hypothetical protein
MLRNTIRRGGITLALLLALGVGLIGAAPAAAQGLRSDSAAWEGVWSWLTGLFGVAGSDQSAGNDSGLSGIWSMEGAGFDPYGQPVANGNQPGPTTNEGAGFDPYGIW